MAKAKAKAKPKSKSAVKTKAKSASAAKGKAPAMPKTGIKGYRALSAGEIRALVAGGSSAEDWGRVAVADGFQPRQVARSRFSGSIRLGRFRNPLSVCGVSLPSGVYDSTLHEVTVGDDALVRATGLLAGYDVEAGACVSGCGSVTVEGETSFGNGVSIEVLNEGGGRELVIFDRLSAQMAYLAVCYRHRPKLVEGLTRMAEAAAAAKRSARGWIGAGARVQNCGSLRNLWVGPAATVDGALRLENGSILSKPEAPSTVGAGVVAADFIIGTGSTVDGRAILTRCFVGQGCRIGRQFSAENSAFFANCEGFHGEAVAVLAGPYTVTHHKSTLLIAGMFSFYNAGSGSNQSNHMYKLGPVHQGVLERGAKTGSFSYLLWPARVGAFTAVIGKHYANFDARNLPFSYINDTDGRTVLSPAVNLFTVGTKRDGDKWPSRDRRKDADKLDRILFPVFSPLTIGRMMAGLEEITALYEKAGREQEFVPYRGLHIKRLLCRTAKKQYAMAITAYLGGLLADRLEAKKPLAAGPVGTGEWVDWLGLLVAGSEAEALCAAVENGAVADLAAFEARLDALHAAYAEHEWAWACAAWRARSGKAPAEMSSAEIAAALSEWQDAAVKLDNMIASDAEKEFAETARLSFGVDGDAQVRDRDFEAVRGTLEGNKFVKEIRKHAAAVAARAEALAKGLA